MELYIVRHGQSFNNALEGTNGERVCDPPLTEVGETQAKLIATHLESNIEKSGNLEKTGFGITRIFCSAMLRALQTTAPIAESLKIHPEVWIDVHEQGGIWLEDREVQSPREYPGLTRREIEERFPEYLLPREITNEGWWNRPAEIPEQWISRADRVARQLRDEYAQTDEHIALVTHGGFTDNLLQALFQTGDINVVYYGHHNTGVSRISFLGGHRLEVRYLNRVEHLSHELVT